MIIDQYIKMFEADDLTNDALDRAFFLTFVVVFGRVWKTMSGEELWIVALDGDADQVARLLDDEGSNVNSMDEVSVFVLCLLILMLFGIE